MTIGLACNRVTAESCRDPGRVWNGVSTKEVTGSWLINKKESALKSAKCGFLFKPFSYVPYLKCVFSLQMFIMFMSLLLHSSNGIHLETTKENKRHFHFSRNLHLPVWSSNWKYGVWLGWRQTFMKRHKFYQQIYFYYPIAFKTPIRCSNSECCLCFSNIPYGKYSHSNQLKTK